MSFIPTHAFKCYCPNKIGCQIDNLPAHKVFPGSVFISVHSVLPEK